jgi:hypothetical protein
MSGIDTQALTTEVDAQVQRPELWSERCAVRGDTEKIDVISSKGSKISNDN